MDPEVRELATAAVTALQTMAANSSPHWTDVAGVFVALLVGGAQCGLIAWGIRVMRDSNLTREKVMAAFARQHEETERQREDAERQREDTERQREDAEREAQRRHEEAMAALTALIERTAPQGNV
ncbi:MAG: hypothetical protein J4F42_07530 [Desulfurellaceae bacterium]|nr:hypothetical protein [Desulfurellaceae bacterium]